MTIEAEFVNSAIELKKIIDSPIGPSFCSQVVTNMGYPAELCDDLLNRARTMELHDGNYGYLDISSPNNPICVVMAQQQACIVQAFNEEGLRILSGILPDSVTTGVIKVPRSQLKPENPVLGAAHELNRRYFMKRSGKVWSTYLKEMESKGEDISFAKEVHKHLFENKKNRRDSRLDYYRYSPQRALEDIIAWGFPAEVVNN